MDIDFQALESRLDTLLQTYQQARDENAALRSQVESLTAARDNLNDKLEHVRSRVEALTHRMQTLEYGA